CQGRFPASLIYVLIVSPSPAVPSTFMPLPSRNTSAGHPVVLDTALLPCSFLPPSAKETRSDCLCPDGCAPRGSCTVYCCNARRSDDSPTNQDQPRQPFFFDRPDPAFCVRVQIRASCWQAKRIHASRLDQFSK